MRSFYKFDVVFKLCVAVFVICLSARAHATVLKIAAFDRGWVQKYDNIMAPDYSTANYAAADCVSLSGCGGFDFGDYSTGGTEVRNYFRFRVPTLDGPVISASLVLSTGFIQVPQPRLADSITYVVASGYGLKFGDFGTGTLYGLRTYTLSDQHRTEQIILDAAARTAIGTAASTGLSFDLSGRLVLTNAVKLFGAGLFGETEHFGYSALHIITRATPVPSVSPVPIPGSFSFFAPSLVALGLLGRRRRRKGATPPAGHRAGR